MKQNYLIVILLIIFSLVLNCYKSESENGSSITPERIYFSGVGDIGIFDPSLTNDPDSTRIWMTYSIVDNAGAGYEVNQQVSTGLAYSDNSGSSWSDSGTIINQSYDIDYGTNRCTWRHEVSSMSYDPDAPASERWKIVWHRYLSLGTSRLFEYSWIAMKKGATPQSLAMAAEIKLFAGSLYATITDPVPGTPPERLDLKHADLADCLAFSEPSVFYANNTLYICMLGAEGASTNGRIILVKSTDSGTSWAYCGSFLVNSTDGPLFGYDGFSAPSVYSKNGIWYLIVTPQTADKYIGTMVFEITSLDSATLKRTGGKPNLIFEHHGTPGSHNGASGYLSGSTGSGIIYSEVIISTPMIFKIFMSHINP